MIPELEPEQQTFWWDVLCYNEGAHSQLAVRRFEAIPDDVPTTLYSAGFRYQSKPAAQFIREKLAQKGYDQLSFPNLEKRLAGDMLIVLDPDLLRTERFYGEARSNPMEYAAKKDLPLKFVTTTLESMADGKWRDEIARNRVSQEDEIKVLEKYKSEISEWQSEHARLEAFKSAYIAEPEIPLLFALIQNSHNVLVASLSDQNAGKLGAYLCEAFRTRPCSYSYLLAWQLDNSSDVGSMLEKAFNGTGIRPYLVIEARSASSIGLTSGIEKIVGSQDTNGNARSNPQIRTARAGVHVPPRAYKGEGSKRKHVPPYVYDFLRSTLSDGRSASLAELHGRCKQAGHGASRESICTTLRKLIQNGDIVKVKTGVYSKKEDQAA